MTRMLLCPGGINDGIPDAEGTDVVNLAAPRSFG